MYACVYMYYMLYYAYKHYNFYFKRVVLILIMHVCGMEWGVHMWA